MPAFISKFIGGDFDAFWTHVILLGTSIAAEFAVAVGIILETPKEKTVRERVGMVLVIGGVCIGAIFTVLLFVFDEGVARKVYDIAQTASRTAAAQGVQVVQQDLQLQELKASVALIELQTDILATKPATHVPPNSLQPRHITAKEARIIKATTLPGATVSIIPYLPGAVEEFADALAGAFEAVPGAQVAVGRGNVIMNGQTGLIVQYDHSNSVAVSVFNALVKAGLKPTEGTEVPGSVVYIKVASL